MRRRFVMLCCALAVAGTAATAQAQYMYLDTNGDGVYNPGNDHMNANGVPTQARLFVVTDRNRDGSAALCNSDEGNGNPPGTTPLTINSYAFNLAASGGTVQYSGFANQQPSMNTAFGEINLGDGSYKNGFGGATILSPGTYHLATLTITGTAGSPSIRFVDQIAGSADFTSFGTRCDGNGFDSTYKLDGPNTQAFQTTADWFDADGLGAGGGNQTPVLAPIGNKTGVVGGCEPVPVTFTATATDPDAGQTLTFSLGAGAPAGATIHPSTGAFSWQPTTGGSFPVTVIVTDNGSPPLSDSETILIVIGVVNQVPILNAIGNKTVNEGTLLTFVATATDPCAAPLTFVLGPGAPAGASITPAGTFTWTPTEAQAPGVFTVTVIVSNGNTTDFETFQITVNEVNTAPVLAPIGNKIAVIGTPLTFTATATDADLPTQTLTFSLGAGAPAGATIGASTGNFSWTPSSSGSFPVTIIVTDNGIPSLTDNETITISTCLGCTGTPPTLAPIGNKTVNELALLSFTATATDPDAGQTLTFLLAAGAPAGSAITAGGAFTWTPTEVQGPGTFPITVIVTDGTPFNDTETIQVTVNEVNVAPVLALIGNKTVQPGALLSFVASATDADFPANDPWIFSLGAGAPAGAAITAGGTFTWTPTIAQQGGVYPITVIVTDSGSPPLSDSELFSVTVGPFEGSPVLAPIGNKTVSEGTLLTFTASATPEAGGSIVYTLASGAPAGAAINASSGVFTWTPSEAQGPGVYPITVIATETTGPNLSDSETFQVTVTEVNSPPILTTITDKTVNEGELLAFTATASDPDLPAQTLTFSLDPGSTPAGASITPSGNFTWTPTEAQGPSSYLLRVRVEDSGTPPLGQSMSFGVTVDEVNTPPILATIGNQSVQEGSLLTVTPTAVDPDIPPQTLQFFLVNGPPGAEFFPPQFSWIPTEAQGPGIYSATIGVTDGIATVTQTFSITVTEVNLAPVLAQPADMSVDEGQSAAQQLTATDVDIPANALAFNKVSGPLFVTVAPGGLVTVTPGATDAGSYPVTVRVSDGLATDLKSYTVTVNPVNFEPLADAGGPYLGVINTNVAFDGSLSADPDGDALTYSWDFGDGTTGTGATPVHAYLAFGTYTVSLTVDDGSLADTDITSATIFDRHSAFAFTIGGNKSIKLNSGKPQSCVNIEPMNGAYENSDVDLATIRMVFNGNQIFALSGKTSIDGDANRNGVMEITACFSKEDLRVLFSGQPNGDYEVLVRGDLVTGGFFEGAVTLHVTGGSQFAMAASISPNPLNPKATLTFATSTPGMVRVQMFDVQGRLIRTLMDESSAPAGYHDVTIDGKDANGNRLASGVYYLKIHSVDGEVSKAITILK